MKDRVGIQAILAEHFDGLVGGHNQDLILRRHASRFTSSITGSEPYFPEPTTSRRHSQGISSSTESGVCPNSSRNFREGFFLRLRILLWSITTSCS